MCIKRIISLIMRQRMKKKKKKKKKTQKQTNKKNNIQKVSAWPVKRGLVKNWTRWILLQVQPGDKLTFIQLFITFSV